MKRVVVTGMGVYSPIGHGLEVFERSLRKGQSGIDRWDALEKMNYVCQLCARPDPLTKEVLSDYFSELTIKNLKHIGVLYGCIAGLDAWKDANLPIDAEHTDWDSGTIFGAGCTGNDLTFRRFFELADQKKIRKLGSRVVEQMMNSGVSAHLGGLLGLGNQVTSNSSACATGTEAFVMSYDRIAHGKAKRMIAGGCEGYSEYGWAAFDAMRVLCRDSNLEPQRGSRPMSDNTSGFVPGAGAGALILEELETAQARGAKIYAEVLGANSNAGGQRNKGTMTRPNTEGVRRCITAAIQEANINPKDIDLIAGHLTSTMGDVLEVQNWSQVLGLQGKDFPYINSLKSMLGHCLAASGAIELTAAILQLQHDFIHPSLNSEKLHPQIQDCVDREKIPLEMTKKRINIVAKSSFGFGDVNSCVILKKWN